jgi:outer membrane lipoprotein-sorting protein
MKHLSVIKNLAFIAVLLIFTMPISAQSNSEKANAIAKEILEAMGGMDNYNDTHFIKWDFGKRTLYWDKWSGDVRIESPEKNLVILVNINTLNGKVYENGILITDNDKSQKLLTQGKNWWINDSYWLVMPWKLQDPGVSLDYVKTDTLPNGKKADVLQLTFDSVGVTPDNKYHIYIDQEDHLIKQWAFFKSYNDGEPKFSRPWDNYQKMGDILLSFNRSEFGPTNVVVKKEFDTEVFSDL